MPEASAAQLIVRLASETRPQTERLAALLGATLRPYAENPDWMFYSFELRDGAFANGLLRLSRTEDAALLSLSPRDPPGLTEADLDSEDWGVRRDARPMPRVSPEGADQLIYLLGPVIVSALWAHTSRRLVSLTLEWPLPNNPAEDPDLS